MKRAWQGGRSGGDGEVRILERDEGGKEGGDVEEDEDAGGGGGQWGERRRRECPAREVIGISV